MFDDHLATAAAQGVSVADASTTAATATAHGENEDHDDGCDGCDCDPEEGSTENTLHDRHPSLWLTFTW